MTTPQSMAAGLLAAMMVSAAAGAQQPTGASSTLDSAMRARLLDARVRSDSFSPAISVIGDLRANAIRPGPPLNSFEARRFELTVQAALDSAAITNLVLSANHSGAT